MGTSAPCAPIRVAELVDFPIYLNCPPHWTTNEFCSASIWRSGFIVNALFLAQWRNSFQQNLPSIQGYGRINLVLAWVPLRLRNQWHRLFSNSLTAFSNDLKLPRFKGSRMRIRFSVTTNAVDQMLQTLQLHYFLTLSGKRGIIEVCARTVC